MSSQIVYVKYYLAEDGFVCNLMYVILNGKEDLCVFGLVLKDA